MKELKIYIVSSDIFDQYIWRKSVSYKYQQQSCIDPRLDFIRQDICNMKGLDLINRVFVDYPIWDLKGEYSEILNNTLLVDNPLLPKLTYKHYKHYTQENVL
ncbi:hypothetical protein [Vibrio phage S4-7]|nr:hypothetical protein [Vibrio phage S4-7]